jgi:hypothetical protein
MWITKRKVAQKSHHDFLGQNSQIVFSSLLYVLYFSPLPLKIHKQKRDYSLTNERAADYRKSNYSHKHTHKQLDFFKLNEKKISNSAKLPLKSNEPLVGFDFLH